jgi:hypothetical protein
MDLRLEKVLLGTSRWNLDEDGVLLYVGGRLVAIFVRLSADHGELEGHWHLEASFGLRERMEPFPTMEEAAAWAAQNREA